MAIDPITATLTAGTIVGNLLQGREQKREAEKALAYQRALAEQQMRFAKSSRTDAYGNKVRYDEALGEWKTDLDPYQDRIIKAGEREQLLSLTKDAGANRGVRERSIERGRGANEDYNRTSAEFRYGTQPSEGSIEDRLTRLLSLSSGSNDSGGPNQQLSTQGNVPNVQSGGSGAGANGVSQLAKILMQARSGAVNEFGARAGARNSRYLPAMQSFERTASAGGDAPLRFSDTPDRIGKEYGDMSKLISTAYQNNSRGVGGAYDRLSSAAGKQFPSIGDTSRLISVIKGGPPGRDGRSTEVEPSRYFGGSPEDNEWLNPSIYQYQ